MTAPTPDQPPPTVMVATTSPVAIRVSTIADERTPDGSLCIGTFIGERLVARRIVPPETVDEIVRHGLFEEPVHLGLIAVEEPPGLQCRLLALIEAERMSQEEESPEEPWKTSVPQPEFEQDAEPEPGEAVPVMLGHIVRLDRDRKHPDDLHQEAVDVLQTVLTGKLSEVVDRLLEDLLEESEGSGGPDAPPPPESPDSPA